MKTDNVFFICCCIVSVILLVTMSASSIMVAKYEAEKAKYNSVILEGEK